MMVMTMCWNTEVIKAYYGEWNIMRNLFIDGWKDDEKFYV